MKRSEGGECSLEESGEGGGSREALDSGGRGGGIHVNRVLYLEHRI